MDVAVAIAVWLGLGVSFLSVFLGPFQIGRERAPLTGGGYLAILAQAAMVTVLCGRVLGGVVKGGVVTDDYQPRVLTKKQRERIAVWLDARNWWESNSMVRMAVTQMVGVIPNLLATCDALERGVGTTQQGEES